MTKDTGQELYNAARKTLLHTAYHSDVLDEREVGIEVLRMLFSPSGGSFSFRFLEKCRPFVRAAILQVLAGFGERGWTKTYDIPRREDVERLLRLSEDTSQIDLSSVYSRKHSEVVKMLEATLPEAERSPDPEFDDELAALFADVEGGE